MTASDERAQRYVRNSHGERSSTWPARRLATASNASTARPVKASNSTPQEPDTT